VSLWVEWDREILEVLADRVASVPPVVVDAVFALPVTLGGTCAWCHGSLNPRAVHRYRGSVVPSHRGAGGVAAGWWGA
jgi:hypothetical protein